MLIELLKQFNIDFCAVSCDNVTDIILMLPYSSYKNYPPNCAKIDSFYIASNTLYNKAKEIEACLRDNGFEVVSRHLNLKKVAEVGGLGCILNNQLLANKKYGTKTTLQGISIVGEYEFLADGKVDKICDNCKKCDLSCPNHALSSGTFVRENCIRHKQDFAKEYFEIVGGRVLGCEECQKVCPYNAKIEKIDMPQSVQKLFDCNNILGMIKNGKKGLEPLADLIGSNMARPTYLFGLVVNSLISSRNFDYTEVIKSFANHQSEVIQDKVAFYLQKVNEFNGIK